MPIYPVHSEAEYKWVIHSPKPVLVEFYAGSYPALLTIVPKLDDLIKKYWKVILYKVDFSISFN